MENGTDSRIFDLGPQYKGDSHFAALMRRHQSWYRARVLGVPYGVGPKRSSKNSYGNMLNEDHGNNGLNFLSPEIFNIAKKRSKNKKGLIEQFRLHCNMMSSQPMCFNLFGLLSNDLSLATALFRKIFPDEIERVTQVVFEHFPEPKSEFLDDRTAFDAFVEFIDREGDLSFIGIETKLTEPFSTRTYDCDKYRYWMQFPDSPWKQNARDVVSHKRHNQLWRDHLLAVAMVHHQKSKYNKGHLMLIRHSKDIDCASAVDGYKKLLTENTDTFLDMPLDTLIIKWREGSNDKEIQKWLDNFCLRYLDLNVSESAIRWEESLQRGEVLCSICMRLIGQDAHSYPYIVCHECDDRALNSRGAQARQYGLDNEHAENSNDGSLVIIDSADDGDNPIFIDGIKCWRRYRFGGWITMRDVFYCENIGEFYKKAGVG